MKFVRLLFFFILFAVSLDVGARVRDLSEALDSLDVAIRRRPEVVAARLRHVDSLKRGRSHHPHPRRLDRDIARAYAGLNIDSALTYYYRALHYPDAPDDSVSRTLTLLEYARQLGKYSLYGEASAIIDSLLPARLPLRERMTFYDVRSQLLLDQMAASQSDIRRDYLRREARSALDSLRVLVAPYPGGARIAGAVIIALDGDSTLAAGELYEVLDSLDTSSPTFAIASGLLAGLYRHNEARRSEYLYFLTLAAAADMRRGDSEAYSLETLGAEMLQEGNFDRSLLYISTAGNALRQAGTRAGSGMAFDPLTTVVDSMRAREHSRNVITVSILSVLFAVIVLSFVALTVLHRRSRRTEAALAKSQLMVEAKDRYVTELLGLCAAFLDAMEEFNRLVARKIKANQTKDLYETVESGKILKQQIERFYTDFDRAVFQIFPDFDKSVNTLFAPDKQIELPEPGRLTPELRIAAFMRLGVNDSSQIAKFLGLSLNTVYTYRNRMRTRAVDRDEFESQLLKI